MATAVDPDIRVESSPFHEVFPRAMASKRYSIVVRRVDASRFLIQLTRIDQPDAYAHDGHGRVVRELLTGHLSNLAWVVSQISTAAAPEAWCCGIETPYNCEEPGAGRISLDSTAYRPRE